MNAFRNARFLRTQESCFALAMAVYLSLFLMGGKVSVLFVLPSVLLLGNFMLRGKPGAQHRPRLTALWLIYGIPTILLAPFSWKIPCLIMFALGGTLLSYVHRRRVLEQRNHELQNSLEKETRQHKLQEQELQRAREIQQSLLPKEIPQIPGFEIAGAWEPARMVGGDYFDVIKLSESKIAVCIADVVGKSISAALLMANVQAKMRALATEECSPGWLCTKINAELCESMPTGKFVTFFYCVLDAEAGCLQYANAGHLPPVLIRPSGNTIHLDQGGALLGIFPDWKYEDAFVQFAPGDRVVLFTDGITEAARCDGEEFGEERLIQIAKNMMGESSSNLQSQLLANVKTYCDMQLLDDATLVVIAAIKRQPSVLDIERGAATPATAA